jgi:hypothetical protein
MPAVRLAVVSTLEAAHSEVLFQLGVQITLLALARSAP